MRYLLLLLTCLGTFQLTAQVMGNYRNQRPQVQSNYQPAFRSVQRTANLNPDPNIIEMTVNALSNQQADAHIAIFSVFQSGKTAKGVNQAMNQRLEAVTKSLEALGIDEDDVYIDMVNFLPTYAYNEEKKIFSKKTLTEVPTGFNLQKNLHVRYRKAELLDQVITVAAEEEIYDIIKVDYAVNEPQKIYEELRKMAFEHLDGIKEQYAQNGIALDTALQHAAESAWVVYPGERYETYSAHASQKLTKQEAANAVVTKVDKPTLSFYQAIPANDYDLVINPDLLEPAAQFTYSLKVRFTLHPPKAPVKPQVITEVKKQFMYLTPDGKVVPLVLQ
ncbi:MAG: SIMPL domain-containing protein [Lewinella sp.]